MRFDLEKWKERSRDGEVCGIVGCPYPPVWDCWCCKGSYCSEHEVLHPIYRIKGEKTG